MAKKLQLSYKEIEERLRTLKDNPCSADEVGYRLLYAFGKTERDIERYKEGKGIIKTFSEGLLVKGLFCYKPSSTLRLLHDLDELKNDNCVIKAQPKIVAVSDGQTIRAFDLRQGETFEQRVARLFCDFEFFYPLAGVERIEYTEESPADIKAAEKLAKLHDEIRAYNEFTSDSDIHDLNTFIARLLFCFFAEDTGIFANNVFTDAIVRFTNDATNLMAVLDQMFRFMGGKPIPVGMLQTYCKQHFAYVGGGLFERDIQIPQLSMKARKIIIESGELDWQNINPDIFGSMIQAVVNPEERATQGMHYTSVPNIMKVINPLFLDELNSVYDAIAYDLEKLKTRKDIGEISRDQFYALTKPLEKRCNALLLRISKMKFFDPACGSGNFLIITYKALRLLEMKIFSLVSQCNPQGSLPFIDRSFISIQQFYGIELLDFPHEVARLSLWLAEHQMNKKMHEDFGVNTQALPLHDIQNIRQGNACRIDWTSVCPHTKDEEVFVFGNPPYLGSKLQTSEQKKDITCVFGNLKNGKILDYISIWFYKGAQYIKNSKSKFAFVSTNSICQGEQVAVLWPNIFIGDLIIEFAYTSFKWKNNAKHNAGVTCVIIGISNDKKIVKVIYTDDKRTECKYISPYLTRDTETIVSKNTKTPKELPKLCFGCMPYDGGNLLMNAQEFKTFSEEYPNDTHFIKRIFGSEEFIKDIFRYCLWIDDQELTEAKKNPIINQRIEATRLSRLKSDCGAELAERPHQFREHPKLNKDKIIIPRVSSERREYIPMGYLGKDTVISDSAFAIYDASLWLFGILTSEMHMTWVRAVGGRLETRYRYSAGLCYNTFPFPPLSASKKEEIEEAATEILMTREPYLAMGKTLADLYDPDKMPKDLKDAHHRLDNIVESCYTGYPFTTDEERLECLFKLYEKMTKTK